MIDEGFLMHNFGFYISHKHKFLENVSLFLKIANFDTKMLSSVIHPSSIGIERGGVWWVGSVTLILDKGSINTPIFRPCISQCQQMGEICCNKTDQSVSFSQGVIPTDTPPPRI